MGNAPRPRNQHIAVRGICYSRAEALAAFARLSATRAILFIGWQKNLQLDGKIYMI